jgi:peptidyl-prolyl cis-trans isomerase B (cyclophilin B)
MKKLFTLLLLSIFNLFIMTNENQASAKNADEKYTQENLLNIETKYGKIVIELMPQIAPKHVERIKALANRGFYDNVPFHRVIDGFMAQTGDPTGTGTGGSELPDLKAEFSDEPHIRGALSMARASSPNSANSQFFIVLKDSRFLDGQYTVFGRVIDGMEFVDQIKKGGGQN